MTPRRRALLAGFGAAVLGFAFAAAYWASNPRARALDDSAYLERASRTPQAREFTRRYPEARTSVDRSDLVAVDFRVDGAGGRYLRLRVVFNRFWNIPDDVFTECSGGRPERDVLGYLATESCLSAP